MRYIITRHAETIENQKGIFQGQSDGHISSEGLKQIKKLADRLKREKIDVIFSSDLERVVKTTQEIIKFHSEVPVFFEKDLRERDLGSWVGKKRNEVNWLNVPKDIETKEEMLYRIKKVYIQSQNFGKKSSVLFVAHSGVNKIVTALILGKSLEYAQSLENQPNASLIIIKKENSKKTEIQTFNDISHLK